MTEQEFKHEYDTLEEARKVTDNLGITINFEVQCTSNVGMSDKKSIVGGVIEYLHSCIEAMDDSMRHWGDHYHCIEAVSVKLEDLSTGDEHEVIDLLDGYYNSRMQNYYLEKLS